jgi:hypothetical protein
VLFAPADVTFAARRRENVEFVVLGFYPPTGIAAAESSVNRRVRTPD